jgi:transmembrane protein EpsG
LLYFIAMTAACCFYVLLFRQTNDGRRSLLGNKVPNPLALVLPVIWFTFISGYRKNVGDTVFYRYSYVGYAEYVQSKPIFELKTNTLFGWVQYYATQFRELEYKGEPQIGQMLILIVAIMFLIPAFVVLYRYSESFSLAIFLLLATGTYFASMNGIRQYAATGLLLLGTHFFFSPDMRKAAPGFIAFALLASMMHSSALVMIPVFFVVRFRAFSKVTMLVLLGAAGAVLFSGIVMPSLFDSLQGTDYEVYAGSNWLSTEHGSSLLRVMASAAPLYFAYRFRDRFREIGVGGDVLINSTILLVAINIMGLYNWIFVRLAIYLYIYQILFLCKVFSVIKKEYGASSPFYLAGLLLFCIYGYYMNIGVDDYRNVWLPNFRNQPHLY